MQANYKSFSHKHSETFSSYLIFFIRSAKGGLTSATIKHSEFCVGYLTRNERGKALSYSKTLNIKHGVSVSTAMVIP
jgi:hypothetical protein